MNALVVVLFIETDAFSMHSGGYNVIILWGTAAALPNLLDKALDICIALHMQILIREHTIKAHWLLLSITGLYKWTSTTLIYYWLWPLGGIMALCLCLSISPCCGCRYDDEGVKMQIDWIGHSIHLCAVHSVRTWLTSALQVFKEFSFTVSKALDSTAVRQIGPQMVVVATFNLLDHNFMIIIL